jgi:hypothetical protein
MMSDEYEAAAEGAKSEWAEEGRRRALETYRITLENRIRLQHAAAVLRDVLPDYGIDANELHRITRPLALKVQQLLETEGGE